MTRTTNAAGGGAMGEARANARVAWVIGLGCALLAAGAGFAASRVNSLLSPVLIAIVLGIIAGNTMPMTRYKAGLDFAGKRLLRAGIVLLGLQLSVTKIVGLGWGVVALAVAVVALGVPFGTWAGRRLGLSPEQSVLVACGFSICGAAAVAACDGVSDADDEDVTTAVALVVLFGTLMIPVTYGVAQLGLSDHAVGIFIGASVHEVAQVVAAGGLIGSGALAVAVVVKLARVLMLAPVMTVLAARRRRELARRGEDSSAVALPPLVPLFVVGFVGAVVVRTLWDVPTQMLDGAKTCQSVLLAAAMFALGTGVRWSTMRTVGRAPFVHAAMCTLFVGALGLSGALLLG